MTAAKSGSPGGHSSAAIRGLIAMVGPVLACLTMGAEGVVVLAIPHVILGTVLWISRLRAWRGALYGALLGGSLGTIFMAATHLPAERRYLAAFVLFGSVIAPIGGALSAYRQGYRRMGMLILIPAGVLFSVLILFILVSG